MPLTLTTLAAAYGAAAGLLLPRAAHRLAVAPDEDWRADCPAGHPITGPARGWLGRAACPRCGAYGPAAVPTATATALVCALLAAATGAHPELAVWLLAAPVLVLLVLVDRRVRRLPDVLTLPLAAAAAALLGAVATLTGAPAAWRAALLGGLALGGLYLLLHAINPGGMGLGDVKLALGLGIALGWYGPRAVVTGAAAGILLGGLHGAALLLTRRARRSDAVPFGPFLIAGALCGLLPAAAGVI